MQNHFSISSFNVLLIGFMGSGKSSVSKKLARAINASLIDTDDLILEISNEDSISNIFEKLGDEEFRRLERKALLLALEKKSQVIATGGGTLIYNNVQELKVNNFLGTNDKIIYLESSFETCKQRCGNTSKRPLFKDLDKAKQLYEERLPIYSSIADFTVKIDDLNPQEVANVITAFLHQPVN